MLLWRKEILSVIWEDIEESFRAKDIDGRCSWNGSKLFQNRGLSDTEKSEWVEAEKKERLVEMEKIVSTKAKNCLASTELVLCMEG